MPSSLFPFPLLFLLALGIVGRATEPEKTESEKAVPVILEQSISRARVYPQQPVELSVSLYVEDAARNTTGLDPFTRAASYQAGRIPLLSLAWGEDQKIPKPLYPVEPGEIWTKTIPQGRVGFAIAGLTPANYLYLDLFLPTPEKVLKSNAEGHETLYWKYTIRRRLLPTASGEITFPPARFFGIMLETTLDSDSQPAIRPVAVSVESEPVQLTILDVPQENRPANDVGLFGLFDWSVDLTPKTAKVGEPLALTMTFHGIGSIVHAKAPDLAQIPQVAVNFRTYPATEEIGEDFYRFLYTIRPKASGSIVFPEIVVSYFNVDQEQFTELKSLPIATTISDAAQIDVSAATRGGEALAPKHHEPLLTESGIFANLTESTGGQNHRISPKFYFTLLCGLGITYCVVATCVFLLRVRKMFRQDNPTAHAIEQARNRFARLPELLDAGKPYEACVQTHHALIALISQVARGTASGITPAEAIDIAREWKLQETQIEELCDLFDHLDAIRFGALPPEKAAQSVKRGTAILEDLIFAISQSVEDNVLQ